LGVRTGGDKTPVTLSIAAGVRGFVTASSLCSVCSHSDSTDRTVTRWSGIRWPAGTIPTLTTAPNKADVFSFIRLGSGSYWGFVVGLNLQKECAMPVGGGGGTLNPTNLVGLETGDLSECYLTSTGPTSS
jgi:hypothetical protein